MRNWILLFIVIVLFNLSGCGKDAEESAPTELGQNDDHANADTNTAYIAEPLAVPHEQIYCEAVYENYLYYIGGEKADDASGGDIYFVRTDMDSPDTPMITRLDITIPTDPNISEPYMMMSMDESGIAHILVYHYSNNNIEAKVLNAFWYQVDENGNQMRAQDVSHVFDSTSFTGVGAFAVDADGNAYICFDNEIIAVNGDGSLAFTIPHDNVINLFRDSEGKVNIFYAGKTGNTVFTAAIDFSARALREGREIIGLGDMVLNGISMTSAERLFIADEDNAYDYELSRNKKDVRFSWESVGIAVIGGCALPLQEDRVLYTYRNPQEASTAYQVIRPMTAAELAAAELLADEAEDTEVSVITIGATAPLPGFSRQIIIDINKANPNKRIEVIYYGQIGDNQHDRAMLLDADIASGKCPDIIYSQGGESLDLYARLGIIQDLYPYMESEPIFDMNAQNKHIFEIMETDGKLYYYPYFCVIEALAVPASGIGDRKEWNMDEFIEYADSFGTGHMIFSTPTKTEVLDFCLQANGDSIVDWNGEDAGINYELTEKILKFANRFIDDEIYAAGQHEPVDVRAQRGEVRVFRYMLPSAGFYQAIFGEPVSYIGYPSERGSGVIIKPNGLFALSANCQDSEAAWSFIYKMILEKDKGNNQAVIEEEIVYELYEPSYSNEVIKYTMTEADLADHDNLWSRVTKMKVSNLQTDGILKEEAGAYFSGYKSLSEVMDIIESRIGIYVMENK